MQPALLVYVVGVVAGVWLTDGPLPVRVALALLWPIGPLAFAATVTILVAASVIAFPILGILAGSSVAVWWFLS